MTPLSPTSHPPGRLFVGRLLRVILVLALGVLVALSLVAPVSAAKLTPCGKKVLNDWWDNGRIDRLYALHCYEEAIDGIPADIRVYSDAEEVIQRALQSAVGGKLAKGGKDPSREGEGDGAGEGGGVIPGETRDPGAPVTPGEGPGGGGGSVAAPDVDGGTSSVPIPLLVLGGMSLALLAAGGIGYLSRRRQAALEGDGDPLDPAL